MPTIPQTSPAASEPLQPVAAILAFVFPGLGHYYLGYTRRAVLIAAGVLGLFFTGLFVGGIDCVDKEENFIWFMGQSLVGPTALAVNYVHQHHFKVIDPDTKARRSAKPTEFRNPETHFAVPISVDSAGKSSAMYKASNGQMVTVSPAYPPKARSLGRMNELGTLFTTVAGFMNLICILDALWHNPKPRTRGAKVDPSLPRTLKVPGAGAAA